MSLVVVTTGIPERHHHRQSAAVAFFSDDELRDDRLMEGQRLQLHVASTRSPSGRRQAERFSSERARFPANSSSPTRSSSPQHARRLHNAPASTVAQSAKTRGFQVNNNGQEGNLGGLGVGANRRGGSKKNRSSSSSSRSDKKVKLLAAINVRRRTSTQRSGRGGGSGSASEGGEITLTEGNGATRSRSKGEGDDARDGPRFFRRSVRC